MSTRTVHCWETAYDAAGIVMNSWLWQIAKAVSSGSAAANSNIIRSSVGIASNMEVSWNVVYALNWTATVHTTGITVNIGGNWQECAKGEVYDLDAEGFWAASTVTPVPG